MLERVGAATRAVRGPAELAGLDALVLPGGESTTMSHLLASSGLREPLGEFMAARPVLATCAGMILLAQRAEALPFPPYGLLDIDVARNAWGRQIFSFQEEIDWPLPRPTGEPGPAQLKAIFIRAPRVTRIGPDVEVLARFQGEPVALRQGRLLALSFHPELTADPRVHAWFLREFLADR
ncbi:pyridoxal 5'-phosphate synthase glutaminase subunit PdxT [bacterium]|nr:pyridoxal 5'-phosphate synthase glutaminase subunit PdxT [bacterium]